MAVLFEKDVATINLDMTYTNYLMLCDAVIKAANHAERLYGMQELIHLVDFLENEYLRDCKKQKEYCKT